jgi:N-acetylmuramoyl-L-alanine amidase
MVTIGLQTVVEEGVCPMTKRIFSLIFVLGLLLTGVPYAKAISLRVDNAPTRISVSLYNSTSYVPLRAAAKILCPNARITWENNRAVVTTQNLRLTAKPGDCYLEANGRNLYIANGVKLANGSTMVPIRVLAKATGASVSWDNATGTVLLQRGSGTILSGESFYDSTSLYWLSRIIYAESSGEPLKGKIAVGNVILNRVKSPDFPNSIYDVIFDAKFGIQFEPVRNGTINNTPNEESILAAKLCLDGASVVGNSIYFLNPNKSTSLWAAKYCVYTATIGKHQFYA